MGLISYKSKKNNTKIEKEEKEGYYFKVLILSEYQLYTNSSRKLKECFRFRSGTRRECSFSPLQPNIVQEDLAYALRQEKERHPD